MDNVTHGLAGLLFADVAAQSLTQRGHSVGTRLRHALSVLGIVAAEFPDSDLLYSGRVLNMGSLGYLLHHRGHTHTIVWAVASAVLLWLGARWWVPRTGELLTRSASTTLLVLALVGTLSHLLLDFTNSYGVHPFWPFDGRWFYGDAVFIVEPWLWLVAIPTLWWNRPRGIGRWLLPFFLMVIVAAIVFLGRVARDVSVLLVVFALVWSVGQRFVSATGRTVSGVAAWLLVTVGFFVASSQAEARVREAVVVASASAGERVYDVALNPGPGDWGCWLAVVVTGTDTTYRVTTAVVAPFSGARSVSTCRSAYRGGRLGTDVLGDLPERAAAPFVATTQVVWRSTWRASRLALAALYATCEG
ncbi:MAG: metal-dependent hydrolase, partial [Gemmatimonas sp.]